jgi:hypothetical protein
MRLRLFDRIRRLVHPRRLESTGTLPQGRHRRDQRPAAVPGPLPGPEEPLPGRTSGPLTQAAASAPEGWAAPGRPLIRDAQPVPARRAPASPEARVGGARARIREAPGEAAAQAAPGHRVDWHHTEPPVQLAPAADMRAEALARGSADTRAEALARAAAGIPHQAVEAARPSGRAAWTDLPFTAPDARGRPRTADGRRYCGSLESILWRQWDPAMPPPPEVIEAVDRLAELPERIKERLAAGLDAIFVGPGGVPELDEMTALRGVRLPSGQASWDACAGAYGERKIVVGSQPSPTPDVMCHEVGHALDDLDSPLGKWQSDSPQFRMLYDQCQPHLASDFHRQPGGLGRKEFFADAFAAIASGQRPALVDMLSGDTRTALRVMLYFNRRYGI